MPLHFESGERFSILVIDDEPLIVDLMPEIFRDMGVEVIAAQNATTALHLLELHRPHLVFLDVNLPDSKGLQLLERIVRIDPRVEVILLSGEYSSVLAVEAIQRGAADYLIKPVPIRELRSRVEHAILAAERNRHTLELDEKLLSSFQFEGMVGRSPGMLELSKNIRRIAPHFRSVLVSGPPGSGKSLVAQALHNLSPSREAPFLLCRCKQSQQEILERDLFGWEKVSGKAEEIRPGLLEQTAGGTLVLDEIGEMSLTLQAKLLEVLQTREAKRFGSAVPRAIDMRLIATTTRDLRLEVEDRRFREDLYYRLSSVHLQVPDLSSRKEDLPLLERHFVQQFAKETQKPITGITRRAQELLAQHSWPGNVREVEDRIRQACANCEGQVLDLPDFPSTFNLEQRRRDPLLVSLKEMQRRHIREVLSTVGGNKLRAAEVLGISRASLEDILNAIEADEPADALAKEKQSPGA
ncbi:MAG TPA: sigma-54 dependent transcriptional regulator [Terriglobales bacterium]|nr:sigma-54 dependent transcriptional regulator [Terriglobales bacterium]